jgi:hypothetical protein
MRALTLGKEEVGMKTFRIRLFVYQRSIKDGEAFGISFKRGMRLEIYRREVSLQAAEAWVHDIHNCGIVFVRSWEITETDTAGNTTKTA